MNKELIFNNKKYISSKDAGAISGYTNDYVARLARHGKVDGRMVGRTWYVEKNSLSNFIQDNKVQKNQLYKKLSNKCVQNYKYSEQDKKIKNTISSFVFTTASLLQSDLFKKGLAATVAVAIVFGGYFAKDTSFVRAGFEKVSRVVLLSVNTIATFDPNDIIPFAKDIAVNIHNGIDKTKPAVKDMAVTVSKLSYTDIKNNINSTVKTYFSYTAENLYTTTQTTLLKIPYDDIQNVSANVFASIVGNIRESVTTTIEDEALYVYTKTNKILCNTFFLPKICLRGKGGTVLVQSEPQEQPKAQEAPRTVINQPVIERIVRTERILTVSGITRDDMELAIQQLKNKVYSDMSNLTAANETRIVNNYKVISQTNKIDKLGNVIISNSTISGTLTGLTDAHIPDDITISGYLALAGGTMTGDLITGSGVKVGIGTSSPTDTLSVDGPVYLSQISAPSVTTDRLYNTSGNLFWNGTQLGAGGGGGSGSWTSIAGGIYNSTTTDQVLIGAIATTSTAKLEVIGDGYFSGNLGIGQTTPLYKLDVSGDARFTGLIDASHFVGTTTATSTLAGGLAIAGQCVTADTRLRRRRRRKKADGTDDELEGRGADFDDDYIYDEVQIVNVKVGDEIASLDQKTGEFTWSRVNKLMPMGIKPLVYIRTTTGRSIRTTDNHPYFVRTKYDKATREQDKQKLYKFEVDQSIKIEDFSRDTVVAIANKESSFAVTIDRKTKQKLRDNMRRFNKPKKFNAIVFALGIVEAMRQSQFDIHELVIDTEYIGYEDVIANIIADAFPQTLEINSLPVGKKSPAHFAAIDVHKKEKATDATVTFETLHSQTENALRTAASPTQQGAKNLASPGASLTKSIYDGKEFVNSGKWIKVKDLKIGQYIAVTHGNTPAWEKIEEMRILTAEMVYDIEVEGTHNFIGNDIVAHNTYLSGLLDLGGNDISNTGIITGTTFNATSTSATSTIAWGLNVNALNVTSTSATSTFANGIDLSDGCFSINGSCVGGGGGAPDQNLWLTVAGDSGSTAANITTDTLTIAGGTNITTAMSGDTLTVNVDNAFLVNDGDDTTTGILTASSYLSSGSGTSTMTNLWASQFQAGSFIQTPYINATSTSIASTFDDITAVDISATNIIISGDTINDFAGTGLTVGGNSLDVDASQTQITAVGALGTGSISVNFGNIDIGASNLDADGTVTFEGSLDIGTAGVRLTGDGDGAITFLGLGNGTDENLIWNFDDTADQVVITTTTGVATTTFTGIDLRFDNFHLAGSATSTAVNGIDLTGGCFSINGTCVGGGGGGSGTINSGTTNRLSYYSGGTTLDSANFLTVDTTSSFFGIGTTSPWRTFSVSGDTALDSMLITFASTTASTLTVDYATTATSTIVNNQTYAWTLATSTTATPIFSINTGSGDYATSSFNGSFDINSGALTYDASANKTSIERLDLGAIKFEDDAGTVSWIDLSVTTSAPSGTAESYTSQIDGNSILTIYAQADGSGGIKNVRTVIGTSTDAILGHANIPYGSLIIADGALCVDDGQGANCDDAAISRGEIAAETITIQNIDLAELYPTKDGNLGAGDVVMFDSLNEVFVTKYDKSASTTASAKQFLGVISTAPGMLLGGFGNEEFPDETKVPVTLSGRVPVKINLEGGDIAIGDRLTASSIAGVATKATTSTATLGIALEAFTASSTSSTIITFIDLAYSFVDSQFRIDENGNIAIGFDSSSTTTPAYKVHVIGDIAATGFVNISTIESKKDIEHISDENRGAILKRLEDVAVAQYRYKYEDESAPLRLGLIAEEAPLDVLSASGDGVDIYKLATFTLAGVQELALKVGDLETRIADIEAIVGSDPTIAGGASLQGVIDYLVSVGVRFAEGVTYITNLIAQEVKTDKLCVGDTCITESELIQLLANANITASTSTLVASSTPNSPEGDSGGQATTTPNGGDTEPPTITINGNNPAEINIGDTYADLGATVTDNVNENLGIKTFLDGIEVSQISIDTASSTNYTIIYSATDQAGNIGTAERTVIVGSGDEGLSSGNEVDGGESLVGVEESSEQATTTPSTAENTASSTPQT